MEDPEILKIEQMQAKLKQKAAAGKPQ